MDTEINQNTIIGHIAGLTDDTKNALYDIFKKSQLFKLVEIIDVDLITTKIIEDTNMEQLFGKYEYYIERSKDSNLSNVENKNSLTKAKNLEKKMFQYWKAKMEYYINKLVNNSKKKIILIGYLSSF
jgi:septin family protein